MYYSVLPDDFDATTFKNKKALDLYRRFVQNKREADGQPTRDRCGAGAWCPRLSGKLRDEDPREG